MEERDTKSLLEIKLRLIAEVRQSSSVMLPLRIFWFIFQGSLIKTHLDKTVHVTGQTGKHI